MVTGTHDFQHLDFGSVLTPERAAALSTASGLSFASILQAANSAMAAVTSNVPALVRALTVQTDQEEAGEEPSANFQVQYGSEYAVAMPQRGEALTHQLPIRKLDIATQFTEDWLDNASERHIAVTLNGLTEAFQKAHVALTLDALFNITALPLTENSTTTSPKFIGFTAQDPAYGKITLADGSVVTSPYTHYLRNTAANLRVAITDARARLLARGESGPFDLFPSPAAASAISLLDDFVDAGDAFVRPGLGADEALVNAEVYLGVIRGTQIRVRQPVGQIVDSGTESWFALVKTNGDNAEGNPIAWRYSQRYGVTPSLRSRSMYPLDYATAVHRVGFGVNKRFGATLVKISASGNYTAPVIRGS